MTSSNSDVTDRPAAEAAAAPAQHLTPEAYCRLVTSRRRLRRVQNGPDGLVLHDLDTGQRYIISPRRVREHLATRDAQHDEARTRTDRAAVGV